MLWTILTYLLISTKCNYAAPSAETQNKCSSESPLVKAEEIKEMLNETSTSSNSSNSTKSNDQETAEANFYHPLGLEDTRFQSNFHQPPPTPQQLFEENLQHLPIAQEYLNPEYDFGYSVDDPITGDRKHHREYRRNNVVHGSYSLIEPDGSKRTVVYTADDVHGFNAVVYKDPPEENLFYDQFHEASSDPVRTTGNGNGNMSPIIVPDLFQEGDESATAAPTVILPEEVSVTPSPQITTVSQMSSPKGDGKTDVKLDGNVEGASFEDKALNPLNIDGGFPLLPHISPFYAKRYARFFLK